MLKAIVNNTGTQEVLPEQIAQFDIVPQGENHFHLIKNNRSYQLEVIETNFENKLFHFKINGTDFKVEMKDHWDQLIDKMGLSATPTQKISEIKAPMPGLVLSVEVEAGQEIEKGDTLLVLEAMKMENVIKAPGEGVVKSIPVQTGEAVEKNALLVLLD